MVVVSARISSCLADFGRLAAGSAMSGVANSASFDADAGNILYDAPQIDAQASEI